MGSRDLTVHHVDLIYSAALESFWRKKALRKFLRGCGISAKFLATWHADETKREFLDRLFEKLDDADRGPAILRQMGRELAAQTSFPDLQSWEDTDDKVARAVAAVNALRSYQSDESERQKQEGQKAEARERFHKQREQAARSQHSLQRLRERLDALTHRVGTSKAGYEFQDWLYDLLDFSEIVSRRPYAINGRQIDGSLTHDGTTYIVELKFATGQTSPIDVGDFRSKVEDKADNTMGLFVSMAGFTDAAIQQASGRKTPVLLLDFNHIYAVLGAVMDFRSVIDRVRRHASQTGESYLAVARFGG